MYCDYVHMQVLHCFPVLVTLKPVFPHRTPVATLLKKLTQSSPVTTGSFKLLKKGWGLTGNFCELFIVKKNPRAQSSMDSHSCCVLIVATPMSHLVGSFS